MLPYIPAIRALRRHFPLQGLELKELSQIMSVPSICPLHVQVELKMLLHVGDIVDFIVDPHTNMDCDGVYIVDMQFWPDSGDTRTWES